MSEVTFKVGDRVRCVDADGAAEGLVYGQQYTVRRYNPDASIGPEVCLDGYTGGFFACRFVPADPPVATRPPVVRETYGTFGANTTDMSGWQNSFPPITVYGGPAKTPAPILPAESEARKGIPLATGCLDYFPAALAAVAELSKKGNDKHNPGEPLHHARGKSTDHADCIVRHLVDRGTVDPEDGILHSVKVAWRALALAQEELEAAGAPKARGAK